MMWVAGSAVVAVLGYVSYRYAWWKPAVTYRYPRILMYHMIKKHTTGKFKGLRVSPGMFEKQVRYLKENGWHFVTMRELAEHREKLPEKTVAITFDDGYEDNYTEAFPILKKYNAKATLYLVVDRHQREWSSRRKAKNDSGELMYEPKLTDEQVREMIESGVFELGSHTLTHPNLLTLSPEEKYEEIVRSKELLEKKFGVACTSFCYPFGLYNEKDEAIVKEAGYSNATTTQAGIENITYTNLFRLKRITVSGKDNFWVFKHKLKTGKRGVRK